MSGLYLTIALACVLGVLHNGEARPTGAPEEACQTMVPAHGSDSSPWLFEVYHNIPMMLQRETQYKITVRSTDGGYFRGFFCQVRAYDSGPASRPYGYFTTSARTQVRDCGPRFPGASVNPAAAITHTERLNVANISFYWAAPAPSVPLPAVMNVVCTVVVNFTTVHIRIPSARFYNNENSTTLTTQPTATPTAPPATTAFNSNNCPQLATATTDAERYTASLYCWNQRFEEWYRVYQNWLANGGQGCATP